MTDLSIDIDLALSGGLLLLKTGAILCVAWIGAVLLRRRTANLRHLLWGLAFGAVLALPLLALWMPPVEIEWTVRHPSWPSDSSLEGIEAANAAGVQAAHGTTPLPLEQGSRWLLRSSDDVSMKRLAGGLLGVWALGAIGLLGLFLRDVNRIRVATLQARPFGTARIHEAARVLSVDRPPRVLLGQVDMPVTWGFLNPVVLLPAGAESWSSSRLRIVLLHEFAHVQRLDYLTHLLAEVACAIYWPNPIVWLARHQLRREQELACDDVVLRAGTGRFDYAEVLLSIARRLHGHDLRVGGVPMAERAGLKTRIRAILDPSTRRSALSRPAAAVLVAAVLIPTLTAAALRSQMDDPRELPGSASAVTQPDGEAEIDVREADAIPRERRAPAPIEDVRPVTLFIEAESGRLISPMELHVDDRASGGRFVMVRDQKGYDAPEGGPGRVTFDVRAESVIRAIWVRVIGEHDNDNSFYVSVDGGDEIRWDVHDRDGDLVRRWAWLPLVDEAGRPLRFDPGHHTLSFRNREDGTRLDAVFMTSDASLVPHGRSPLPPPVRSVSVTFEAEETTRMTAPLEMRTDPDAAGRFFLSVAPGHDSRGTPPTDGRASYTIRVDEPGPYVAWARVRAADESGDSFWLRANGGAWIRWNGIDRRSSWSWQLVEDADADNEIAVFEMQSGDNTIEVAYREDGADIDRLMITNNLYASPGEPDVEVSFRE